MVAVGGSQKKETGVLTAAFIMTSTILGAGIVSFPYGFASTGLISGLVLMAGSAIYSVLASRFLFMALQFSETFDDEPVNSYEELVEVYFGRRTLVGKIARKLYEILMFSSMAAPGVIYLCIISDSICPAIQKFLGNSTDFYTQRGFVISSFAILVVFPVCMLRDISKLKYTSTIALATVIYLVVLIPLYGILGLTKLGGGPGGIPKVPGPGVGKNIFLNVGTYNNIAPMFFMALPIFAFGFGSQVIIVPLYNEMKNPTPLRTDMVTGISFVIVFICYTLVGCFGYLTFGEDTAPDILTNLGGDTVADIPGWIGRIGMGIHCTLAYPVISYVQRESLNSAVFGRGRGVNTVYHLSTTIVVFTGNLLVAILLPNIAVVFGFSVPVGIVVICYVVPAILYCTFIFRSKKNYLTRCCYWCPAIIVILVSLFLMVTAPLTAFFKLYSGS